LNFSDALKALEEYHRVSRSNWNDPNQWVALQVPDTNSKMTLPYIYISTTDGKLVPWLASKTDLLSDDWRIV